MAAKGGREGPVGDARVEPRRGLSRVPVEGTYMVRRLGPEAPGPDWAAGSRFSSVTRTADEVSVVCEQAAVPPGVRCEPGWRCLRVAGTLDFASVGVLAGLVGPLAAAGVSVFVVSTFDTDYLLVKEGDLDWAVAVLQQHRHTVGD
jgi:hypothetical protein